MIIPFAAADYNLLSSMKPSILKFIQHMNTFISKVDVFNSQLLYGISILTNIANLAW